MAMVWKIIQMVFSVGLIVGGLSGELVLRGTDSSAALVAVGVLWLIFDISQFVTPIKKSDEPKPKKVRTGRSPVFFVLCGLYIAANLLCAFLLLDELNVPGATGLELLAICGNAISLAGIVMVLLKKDFGTVVALLGSAVSVAFTIFSGIFIIGAPPRFDTGGFVAFMLIETLPGILLWLQMKLSMNKLENK